MIVCAGRTEVLSYALPIGVGLIESAVTLSKLLTENSVKRLCFVGTAGSYGDIGIHETVASTSCSQIELSSIDKLSYTPIILKSAQKLSDVSRETLKAFKFVEANSSNYICSDFVSAQKFKSAGLQIESMEFFSVLWIAERLNIEAIGLFYITNFCDNNAHKEYLQNLPKALEALERQQTCVSNFINHA